MNAMTNKFRVASTALVRCLSISGFCFILFVAFAFINDSGFLFADKAFVVIDRWEIQEETFLFGHRISNKTQKLPLSDLKERLFPVRSDPGKIWMYTLPRGWSYGKRTTIHGDTASAVYNLRELEQMRSSIPEAEVEGKFRDLFYELSKNSLEEKQ